MANYKSFSMEVAGREEEIELLQNALLSTRSEFLAMYGRRRIGKTYLIRQVYKKHMTFDCSGLNEQQLPQQLENFWFALQERNSKLKLATAPTTWLQAFALLREYITSIKGDKKKVIFLDEIPWFDTPKSGFLAALDNFWNHFCSKRSDILLIVCGSAATWIIDKIINNKGGLHNRLTQSIRLLPFTLAETKAYLLMNRVSLTRKDIVELYMCLGGVPFYLKEVEKGKSVAQIIDKVCLGKNAILRNEFQNLYASLFKNHELHEKIIRALASKNKGLTRNEIIETTGLSTGGGFSTLMKELIECGFVKEITPFGKSKDTLFRLIDEYSFFYLKFLEKRNTVESWEQTANKQSYKIWCGYAFENVCQKHVAKIKTALGISGVLSNEYSWFAKGNATEDGTQIDLLIDRADNCINICEMKFYNATFEVSKQYAETLRTKKHVFQTKTATRKNIFITLVTLFGIATNEHSLSVVSNEMTIEVLF